MIMQAVLWVVFCATVLKTLLVTDAVWDATGRRGLVARAAACWASTVMGQTIQEAHPTPLAGSFTKKRTTLPLAQVGGRGFERPLRKPAPRSVHVWLLCMHFLALLAQGAAVLEYLVPVTDETCLQTRRVMISTFILFDSASVMFLLAKADVTSINRPATAALLTSLSCGGVATDGRGCTAGIEHVHSGVRRLFVVMFLLGKSMLGIQLLVLLALFLRPIVAARGQQGQLSALHRRTVVRNVVCTVGVILLHLVEGVIVYIVVFSDFDERVAHGGDGDGGTESGEHQHDHGSGLEGSEVEIAEHRGSDAAQMIQTLLTLCLTEITITLGFTSAVRSCRSRATQRRPTTAPESGNRIAVLLPSNGIEGTAPHATASNSNRTGGGGGGTASLKESTPHVATAEGQEVESASGAGEEHALSQQTASYFEASDGSPSA